ncbi:atherin-like [Iris pallida]|uniref:Atherin-like n=1 Tax=Iris pallida TaxID=29817 RepID=A0AAX6EJJ8_IRIPA|nr:atherin-like [Iris pallida]
MDGQAAHRRGTTLDGHNSKEGRRRLTGGGLSAAALEETTDGRCSQSRWCSWAGTWRSRGRQRLTTVAERVSSTRRRGSLCQIRRSAC